MRCKVTPPCQLCLPTQSSNEGRSVLGDHECPRTLGFLFVSTQSGGRSFLHPFIPPLTVNTRKRSPQRRQAQARGHDEGAPRNDQKRGAYPGRDDTRATDRYIRPNGSPNAGPLHPYGGLRSCAISPRRTLLASMSANSPDLLSNRWPGLRGRAHHHKFRRRIPSSVSRTRISAHVHMQATQPQSESEQSQDSAVTHPPLAYSQMSGHLYSSTRPALGSELCY